MNSCKTRINNFSVCYILSEQRIVTFTVILKEFLAVPQIVFLCASSGMLHDNNVIPCHFSF